MYQTFGTVVGPDPDGYGVLVVLDPHQSGPAISVEVGTHGPRDAVRGNYPELPLPGQRGVILFPRGDNRNGVWICSVTSGLNDSNPNVAGGMPQHVEYAYGGGVFWRGPDGSEFSQYPDGSTLQIGPSQPNLTRHTVGSGQVRSATPFPLAQRVATAPAASFPLIFTQAGTGASLMLTASGSWTITAAPGQTINFQVSGGAAIGMTDTNITLKASDAVGLNTPNVDASAAINAAGEITAETSGTSIKLSQHVHLVGDNDTSVPVTGT
jgi:phage baseplate assembly protein gpV